MCGALPPTVQNNSGPACILEAFWNVYLQPKYRRSLPEPAWTTHDTSPETCPRILAVTWLHGPSYDIPGCMQGGCLGVPERVPGRCFGCVQEGAGSIPAGRCPRRVLRGCPGRCAGRYPRRCLAEPSVAGTFVALVKKIILIWMATWRYVRQGVHDSSTPGRQRVCRKTLG